MKVIFNWAYVSRVLRMDEHNPLKPLDPEEEERLFEKTVKMLRQRSWTVAGSGVGLGAEKDPFLNYVTMPGFDPKTMVLETEGGRSVADVRRKAAGPGQRNQTVLSRMMVAMLD